MATILAYAKLKLGLGCFIGCKIKCSTDFSEFAISDVCYDIVFGEYIAAGCDVWFEC